MSDFSSMTIVRQILRTDNVTCYSSRAPDNECFLAVKTQATDFAARIALLQERKREVWEKIGFTLREKCHPESCAYRRDCLEVSPLPRVDETASQEESGAYVLRFDCFAFGELISAAELAEQYHITAPTAYRLSIGLLSLVEFLVRLNIYAEISVDNLLIDTNSATLTLIDWYDAKVFSILPIQKTTELYRQAAQVILELAGAKRSESGLWQCANVLVARKAGKLFSILQEVAEANLEIPDRLDAAINYVREVRNSQKGLIPKVLGLLRDTDFEADNPSFGVVEIEKMEE